MRKTEIARAYVAIIIFGLLFLVVPELNSIPGAPTIGWGLLIFGIIGIALLVLLFFI